MQVHSTIACTYWCITVVHVRACDLLNLLHNFLASGIPISHVTHAELLLVHKSLLSLLHCTVSWTLQCFVYVAGLLSPRWPHCYNLLSFVYNRHDYEPWLPVLHVHNDMWLPDTMDDCCELFCEWQQVWGDGISVLYTAFHCGASLPLLQIMLIRLYHIHDQIKELHECNVIMTTLLLHIGLMSDNHL